MNKKSLFLIPLFLLTGTLIPEILILLVLIGFFYQIIKNERL